MGIPNQIVTDNGPQFTATEFEQFCKNNGIHHTFTTPYHPNSIREAERFVQTFKNTMQKEKGEMQLNLSKFLLRYRITPHTATGKSPAEHIFGRQIKIRLDLLHPTEIKQKLPMQKDQLTSPNKFRTDEKMWVRNYHGTPCWLLGVITQKVGTCNYRVKV